MFYRADKYPTYLTVKKINLLLYPYIIIHKKSPNELFNSSGDLIYEIFEFLL